MQITIAAQIMPGRIHALTRLVAQLQPISRDSLFDLLQPSNVQPSQNASQNILSVASYLKLIVEEDEGICLHPDINPDKIHQAAYFRQYIGHHMLNITDTEDDNYMFNLFTAWYATLNAEFMKQSTTNLIKNFNLLVGLESGERAFNTTKWLPWMIWAHFFGWGYPFRTHFIPDATGRITPLLPVLFDTESPHITIGQFIERLGQQCVELDRGSLHTKMLQSSNKPAHSTSISLMVSVALHELDRSRQIKLEYTADAGDLWNLASGVRMDNSTITHIRYLQGSSS